MIVRLSLLVAASIAAYAVRRANTEKSKKASGDAKKSVEVIPNEKKQEEKLFHDHEISKDKFHVEEEEEEVKKVNNLAAYDCSNLPLVNQEEKGEGLHEFEEYFSGEIDFPLDEFDINPDPNYATDLAITQAELGRLRDLVRDLEEREVKLQAELLEYYGLKEQESEISELQKQLKIKTAEIDRLHIAINSFQGERKKLQEEIVNGMSAKKELEVARSKIKELQGQIQLDASHTKGQLMILKQHVADLQQKEEEGEKMDADMERKFKAMKELEVEVVELRRKNKEFQHEKRELSIKLNAAENRASALFNTTENELTVQAREDIQNLRQANEDLVKQVEGLQTNRFGEVEELVYLRWVNACLRYELRNYQTPTGKSSARDLSKSLSPRSQEKAKRLMLEYAESERVQGDTDHESISSHGSDDLDTNSIDSFPGKLNTLSRRPSLSLIQRLKSWGRSKDDFSAMASPNRSFGGNSPMRSNFGPGSPAIRGPLETLLLRNAGDEVAITTVGQGEEEPNGSLLDGPSLPHLKSQASHVDALNSVAESFHLMSKSVEGVAEDKYPAYKDRHKLAIEREKAIKEKAKQARDERFGGGPKATQNIVSSEQNWKRPANLVLPPKLTRSKTVGRIGDATEPSKETGNEHSDDNGAETPEVSKMKLAHVEKRAPRVPRPPPRSRSSGEISISNTKAAKTVSGVPPPPPPPPPPLPGGPPWPPPPPGSAVKGSSTGKVHRAPELVEFYQSLMKREGKNSTSIASSPSNVEDARSNMIGEIANRSEFLLAVKADVETQGNFVKSLASEVRAVSFANIEDLVSFVNWLDEELSFLVDERAVLKHFDWPEGKADALREAAFEYQDLMKLENQVLTFVDDPKLPYEAALKKMYTLLEKMEQSVYALLRTRDMAISRYREFGFPADWLMDAGVLGKIKLASVQLARKYMKRASSELDAMAGTEKEPNREFLVLQGVRFAFRVHQFAGGFDAESMQAFEDLRRHVTSGMPSAHKS